MSKAFRRAARVAMEKVGLIGPYYRWLERRLARRAEAHPFDDGLPMPPDHLITLVSGPGSQWFSESGAHHATAFRDLAQRHGADMTAGLTVLDFGCGCGRIARWLAPQVEAGGGRFLGCDINPKLVAWAGANLAGAYRRNGLAAPMPFADESVDVLYAHSVLTHLTEAKAQGWLDDFARVLKPGGLAIVTFHDEAYAERFAPPEVLPRLQAQKYAVLNNALEGSNYLAAYVTQDRLREMAAGRLTTLEIRGTDLATADQAIAVLRKA